MASEEKKISRLIELTLGFKNQGPDAAAIFARMNAELARFKSANPGATFTDIANHMNTFGRALAATDRGIIEFTKNQQKGSQAAKMFADSLSHIQRACSSLMSPLRGLSALVGGEAIGFGAGIKWVVAYQKQMLSLSSQMSKYGRGLGDINKAIDSVGAKTKLTKKETAELYAIYEKGFPYNSLKGGEELFIRIKNAVGGNSEAIKEMMGFLQGVIEKFPELEDSITNLNGQNAKWLESQSRLAFMSGKLSFAEHKRFQDYLRGGKQIQSADDKARQAMQDQIDSMNQLRQVFEKLTEQIGKSLLPWMQDLSKWVGEAYNKFEPWVPTLTKAAVIFAGIVASAKAVAGIVNTIKFAKAFSDLTGMSSMMKGMWANLGPGGGGAGGWGRKSLGAVMGNKAFLAKGGMGAAAGFAAGQVADYAYEKATGRELTQDHGDAAVAGNVAKTGAAIGAGFATGGVPGAIFAGIANGIENIVHILQAWYGESNSIKSIKNDVIAANQSMMSKTDKQIVSLQDKLAKEQDPGNRARLQQDLQAAQLTKQANAADAAQSEKSSGFGAAALRTAAEFAGYTTPVGMVSKAMGVDPTAQVDKTFGLGGGSDAGNAARQQVNAIRVQQAKQRETDDKSKMQSALEKAKLQIDPEQFKQLYMMLDSARYDGNTDPLVKAGISQQRAGEVGDLWEKSGPEFEKMVQQVAANISGQKINLPEDSPATAAAKGVSVDKTNQDVTAKSAAALERIMAGDLKGGSQAYRSIIDTIDKAQVNNVVSAAPDAVANTMKEFGVDTERAVGTGKQESFASKDDLFNQMASASGKIQSEMGDINARTSAAGGIVSDDDAKRMGQLTKAQDTINAQLGERAKLQEKFLPQMQLLDAAINEQMKSVQATNELYKAQRSLQSAIIQQTQTTGKIDMATINAGTVESIRLLKEYNAGVKQQIALEQEELKIAEQEMQAEIEANKAKVDGLRTKGDDKSLKDADEIELANKKLEIRKSKGVLIQQSNAHILGQLEQTSTIEKQIVDILQERLDLNKANVDFAAANVNKAEALINIYDNLGAGLKASADMRMEAAGLIGKQIEQEKKNLQLIDETIRAGVPAMAAEVAKEKEFAGKSPDEIAAEAKKRLISLDTARVNKETQILGLVSKQAQMTKAIRDGYVSAIMAMTAGSGMFNKILITQDKNLGVGVKYMNVLQSKSSGGIGGGKTKAGQFTTGGLDPGSQEAGYETYDGQMSNNEDVRDIQKNALDYTQKKIAGVGSGASGAMGAPNNAGVVLEGATNGQNVTPPAKPGSLPATPLSISPPAEMSLAPQDTTILQSLNNFAAQSVGLLRNIVSKISDGSSAPQTPAQININLGGVKVDYGDLNKFGSMVKDKIDAALNNAFKQMSGGRSSLPRGNS